MNGGLRIAVGVVGLVVIYFGVRQVMSGVKEFKHAALIKCDSDAARETLKLAFNESGYAQSNKITFQDLTDITETAYKPDTSRSCHGSLKLSNSQVHSVTYELDAAQGGGKGQLRFSMQ